MPNFNLLGAIEAPKVMGQLPVVQPSNSGDSLMGGLMSGLAQGQEMQLNKKRGLLLDEQTKGAKIDNQMKGRELEYAQKLDDHANKTEEQYLSQLRPEDRYKILTLKQQMLGAEAEAKKVGVEAAYSVATYNGVAHSSAAQFKTPEEQERAYQEVRKQAPADVQATMPEHYDHMFAPIAISNGMRAEATFLRSKHGAATGDGRTSDDKNATVIADLQEKVDAGTASKNEELKLQSMKQQTAKTQMITSPSQQVNIATTTERLKETGKSATTSQQQLTVLSQMEQLTDSAFSGQGAGVELKAKQFLEFIGKPASKGTSATEAFNSVVKQAQLNAQTLLKGSSSDRDMQIVEQTGPQLENTTNGRRLMISAAKYKATMDVQYNSFLNAYQNKNDGSLDGADEAWSKFVQSRNDFDSKTLKFNSKELNKKSWEPFLDPNYEAPQMAETATPATQPQAGRILDYNHQTGRVE